MSLPEKCGVLPESTGSAVNAVSLLSVTHGVFSLTNISWASSARQCKQEGMYLRNTTGKVLGRSWCGWGRTAVTRQQKLDSSILLPPYLYRIRCK